MGDSHEKWNSETITDVRLNENTHLTGTSAQRTASVLWPVNMLWWDTDDNLFYRNSGTESVPVSTEVAGGADFFGDGSDGSATDPSSPSSGILQYTDLTFDNDTTWTMTDKGPIYVFVSGTLTIATTKTWIINGSHDVATKGGAGGGNGGVGGEAHSVIIIAKTVVAGSTAKIQINGNDATNGANGASTTGAQVNGGDGTDAGAACTIAGTSSTAAKGGKHGSVAVFNGLSYTGELGKGGTGLASDAFKLIRTFSDLLRCNLAGSGAGGGGGGSNVATQGAGGGGGAGGGDTILSAGGRGGLGGYAASDGSVGGGAGGGGGAVCLLLVTDTMDSDLELEAIGGDGGNGGTGGDTCGGGAGGGGGAAAVILFADSDVGTRTTSVASASSGGAVAGGAGLVGTTADAFYSITSKLFFRAL